MLGMKVYKEDGLSHISPMDQVFTYNRTDTGEQLHFNVSLMDRVRKSMPKLFWKQDLPITQEIYDLCMDGRGIEEPKVAALTPEQIDEPGYGVILDDEIKDDAPNMFVLVDGNHRLVRRFRMGLRTMDVWMAIKPLWEKCLMHPIDESVEAMFRELIPGRDLKT